MPKFQSKYTKKKDKSFSAMMEMYKENGNTFKKKKNGKRKPIQD